MTWRSDTSSLIAGAWVSSAYAGHGIRGQFVPSLGEHGPSLLYPGLNLPTENNSEFRAFILTRPVGLTLLIIEEDSSLQAQGPDGSYVGTWEGFKDGISFGTNTYTINIGPSGTFTGDAGLGGVSAGGGFDSTNALAGNADLGGVGAGGGLSGGSTITGGATLDDVSAGGGVQGGSTIGGGATLDDVTAGGGLASLPNSTISGDAQLDGTTAGGGFDVPTTLSGNAALDDVQATGGLANSAPATLSGGATLDGLSASGGLDQGEETVSFDVFLARVLPHVPGCPDITVTENSRAACIEWFQRTMTWRDTIGPVTAVAAQTDYTLTLPTDSSLAKLTGYWIDDREGTAVNIDRGTRLTKNLSTGNVAWVTTGRSKVTIGPAPVGGELLEFMVAIKPTQRSATLLAELWEHYAEPLEYGALARIFRMPKQPWSDPQLATYYADLFEDEIARKAAAASKAFSRSSGRVRGFFY